MELQSLNGINGAGVFLLLGVGGIAYVISSAMWHFIYRYSPRQIDWTRLDHDEC